MKHRQLTPWVGEFGPPTIGLPFKFSDGWIYKQMCWFSLISSTILVKSCIFGDK